MIKSDNYGYFRPTADKRCSRSNFCRYQQSNREERFGQYEQDNNFQGYNASVQAVVTAPAASSSISQVAPVYKLFNFY